MITEENKLVEVFGTKEVSVKEFMGSSDKSLMLLSDYEKAKQNLLDLKEKHKERVEELVSVEKLSSDELKELNSIRAELREPRYLIQNIEKNNISVFEAYKKTDKANLKGLIEVNTDLEDKATEKLQAEEKRKKDEKEAEAKEEENRIAKIKSDIDNIETYCSEIVQKMTFDNMKVSAESIEQSLNAEYEFEEYDILFDQVKSRVAKLLLDKTNDITARENQRLENEAMKQEIFDVRVNRLKELGFIIKEDCIVNEELNSTHLLVDIKICNSANFDFVIEQIKQKIKQSEQDKRDAEIKKEKDEQFEVRTKRLAEIGILYNETFGFTVKDYTANEMSFKFGKNGIYECSVTEFEEILTNAKKAISDAKEQKEADAKESLYQERVKMLLQLGLTYDSTKEYPIFLEGNSKLIANREVLVGRNQEWFDEFVSDVKTSIANTEKETKKKADAENKARVKRLAKDKRNLSGVINSINFKYNAFTLENKESKDFLEVILNKISDLSEDLLTQLNEL